jgi:hypothetical protein
MIDEPIRWSHAYGKPVVPSSWQMTYSHRVTDRCIWGPTSYASKAGSP